MLPRDTAIWGELLGNGALQNSFSFSNGRIKAAVQNVGAAASQEKILLATALPEERSAWSPVKYAQVHLPFPGKGTGGMPEQWRSWRHLLQPYTSVLSNFTMEEPVPARLQCWSPITTASQHSRGELLSGRQNSICLNCQCFTELVTHQAGGQEEMAF